jgi:hypothetical protein
VINEFVAIERIATVAIDTSHQVRSLHNTCLLALTPAAADLLIVTVAAR